MLNNPAESKLPSPQEKTVLKALVGLTDTDVSTLDVVSRVGAIDTVPDSGLVMYHPRYHANGPNVGELNIRGLVIDYGTGDSKPRVVRPGVTETLTCVSEKTFLPSSQYDSAAIEAISIPPSVGRNSPEYNSYYQGEWDHTHVPVQTSRFRTEDGYYKFSTEDGKVREMEINSTVLFPRYPGVYITVFRHQGTTYFSSNKSISIMDGNSRWGDHTKTFKEMISKFTDFKPEELYSLGTHTSTIVHYFYLVHPEFGLESGAILNPDGFLIYDGYIDLMNGGVGHYENKAIKFNPPTVNDKQITKLSELTGVVWRWSISKDEAIKIINTGYLDPYSVADPIRLGPGDSVIARNASGLAVSFQGPSYVYASNLFGSHNNIYMTFVKTVEDATGSFLGVDDMAKYMAKYPIIIFPPQDILMEQVQSGRPMKRFLRIADLKTTYHSVHHRIAMIHYLFTCLISPYYTKQVSLFLRRFYWDLQNVVSFILSNLDLSGNFDRNNKEDRHMIWVITTIIKVSNKTITGYNVPQQEHAALYHKTAWDFLLTHCGLPDINLNLYKIIRYVWRKVPGIKRKSIDISEPGVLTHSEMEEIKKATPEVDTVDTEPVNPNKVSPAIENLAISGETYKDGH